MLSFNENYFYKNLLIKYFQFNPGSFFPQKKIFMQYWIFPLIGFVGLTWNKNSNLFTPLLPFTSRSLRFFGEAEEREAKGSKRDIIDLKKSFLYSDKTNIHNILMNKKNEKYNLNQIPKSVESSFTFPLQQEENKKNQESYQNDLYEYYFMAKSELEQKLSKLNYFASRSLCFDEAEAKEADAKDTAAKEPKQEKNSMLLNSFLWSKSGTIEIGSFFLNNKFHFKNQRNNILTTDLNFNFSHSNTYKEKSYFFINTNLTNIVPTLTSNIKEIYKKSPKKLLPISMYYKNLNNSINNSKTQRNKIKKNILFSIIEIPNTFCIKPINQKQKGILQNHPIRSYEKAKLLLDNAIKNSLLKETNNKDKNFKNKISMHFLDKLQNQSYFIKKNLTKSKLLFDFSILKGSQQNRNFSRSGGSASFSAFAAASAEPMWKASFAREAEAPFASASFASRKKRKKRKKWKAESKRKTQQSEQKKQKSNFLKAQNNKIKENDIFVKKISEKLKFDLDKLLFSKRFKKNYIFFNKINNPQNKKTNLKFLFLLHSNFKNTNNILKKFKKIKASMPSIKENNIKNYLYELSVLNYWKKSLNLLNLNNKKISYSSKFSKKDRLFASFATLLKSSIPNLQSEGFASLTSREAREAREAREEREVRERHLCFREVFTSSLYERVEASKKEEEFFNKFAKIQKLLNRYSKDSSLLTFQTSNLNPIKLKNSIITSDLFYKEYFNILSNKFIYNKEQNLVYNYHLYSYNRNSKENYINKNFYRKNKKVLGKFMYKSIMSKIASTNKILATKFKNKKFKKSSESKISKNKEKNYINFILNLKQISFINLNYFSSKLYMLIDNLYKILSNDLTKKTTFLETNINNIKIVKSNIQKKLIKKKNLVFRFGSFALAKPPQTFGSHIFFRFFRFGEADAKEADAKEASASRAKEASKAKEAEPSTSSPRSSASPKKRRLRKSHKLDLKSKTFNKNFRKNKKEKIFRTLLSYKFSKANFKNIKLKRNILSLRSFALWLRRSGGYTEAKAIQSKLKKRMRNLLSIYSNNNMVYKYYKKNTSLTKQGLPLHPLLHTLAFASAKPRNEKRKRNLSPLFSKSGIVNKTRFEKKEKHYKNSISLNRILRRIGFVFLWHFGGAEATEDLNKKESLIQRFEKEKSLQKRRRRKKLKLETRRRKKRKRFYPRPVWLRYSLYKKFLNFRHSYNNFYFRKKVFTSCASHSENPLHRLPSPSLRERKKRKEADARSERSDSEQKNEKVVNISNFFLKNQKLKNKIYRNNKQKWGNFIQDTPQFEKISLKKINFFQYFPIFQNKEYYKVSGRILAEFQPLCWKSYWLRSNLTPYINRIEKNFSFMKQVEKTNNISNINTFLYKIFGFFSYDFYSFKFKMLPFYTDFKNSFDNQHAFYLSNLFFQESTNKIAEYNRIEFERFSEILKNVKFNMNLEGQLKPKSYKFIAWKYLLSSRELKTFNKKNFWYKLSYNMNPSLSSVSPFVTLSNTFSKNSASIKPYGSSGTLRTLWTFNKTNIFTFKEKNQIRNLWEQTKLREQLKSNQTKKFLMNLIKVQDNLYLKDIFYNSFLLQKSGSHMEHGAQRNFKEFKNLNSFASRSHFSLLGFLRFFRSRSGGSAEAKGASASAPPKRAKEEGAEAAVKELRQANFSTIKKLQTAQKKLVLLSLFQQKSQKKSIASVPSHPLLRSRFFRFGGAEAKEADAEGFFFRFFRFFREAKVADAKGTSASAPPKRAKEAEEREAKGSKRSEGASERSESEKMQGSVSAQRNYILNNKNILNNTNNISYNYYIRLLKSKISNSPFRFSRFNSFTLSKQPRQIKRAKTKLNTKKNLTHSMLKTNNFVFSYAVKNKKDSPFINIAKPRLLKPSSYFWWSSKNFQIPFNLNMFNDSYTSLFFFSESKIPNNLRFKTIYDYSESSNQKETLKIPIAQQQKTNKLIVYNILIFSILFHLSILFSFIRIPELRGLLKFQILFFYKISNSYFIILYSIYDLLKKYKKETLKTYNSLYEKTYKLLSYINILDLESQSSHSFHSFGNSDYLGLDFRKRTKKIVFSRVFGFSSVLLSARFSRALPSDQLPSLAPLWRSLRFFRSRSGGSERSSCEGKVDVRSDQKASFAHIAKATPLLYVQKKQAKNQSALKYPKIYNKDLKSYNENNLSSRNLSKSFTTYITSQTPFIYSFSYNIVEFLYTKKILKNLYQKSDLQILTSRIDSASIGYFGEAFAEREAKEPKKQTKLDIKKNSMTELYKRFMSFRNIQTYFALFFLYFSYGFVHLSIGLFESTYQFLLKIIDLFESFLLIIYKFLEKPAELMIEWIAQIFLIEWSSDPSSFIPETFDMYFWYSFQKFFRNTRILGFIEFQNSTNIYNIMNSLEFNGKQIQLNNYNNDILSLEKTLGTSIFSFSISNILGFFMQRRLWNFFHLFIDSMLKPDIDLIVRQKKGKIFWDIWADILIRAAEQYNINIPSLTSLKEEQEKLIERLIQDPAFINFSILNSDYKNIISSPLANNLQSTIKTTYNLKNKSLPLLLHPLLRNHYAKVKGSEGSPRSAGERSERLRLGGAEAKEAISNIFYNKNVLKNFYKTKSWSSNQYVTFNLKDTDLFLDISPPKSLLYVHFINGYEPIQYTLGSIMCEIYSGLFSHKVSKNLLIVNSHVSDLPLRSAISSNFLNSTKSSFDFQSKGSYGSLIIQALAGESEMKMMIDNANRYASVQRGVAVGMKLLRDVFESIVLQTPCFFLMEDLHVIGERRPMLISDDENSYEKEFSIFGFEQDEESERNQMIYQSSRHSINDFRRPYKGDFSMLIPTNLYNKNLYSFKTFLNNTKPTHQKKYPISLSSLYDKIENKMSSSQIEKPHNGSDNQSFNISRLQITSENFFAPPATSPFTVLMMKEQRKLKPKKVVKQISWNSFVAENIIAVASGAKNDSIRAKVAILADMTLRNFSYNKDMITDLLVIIDGVRSNRGFVVFATTHLPSILDPALRRPGRFDETISLPLLPNLMNRWSLFQMHFSLSQPLLRSRYAKAKGNARSIGSIKLSALDSRAQETFDRFDYGILTENFNFSQISNLISKAKLSCNVNYNSAKSPIIHPSQALQSFFIEKDYCSFPQSGEAVHSNLLSQPLLSHPSQPYIWLRRRSEQKRKIYSQISFGYFQIGNLLISSDFLKDQTYFSLYNKSLILEQSSPFIFHTLYSSLNTFKMFIMRLLGGKIAEFLVSKNLSRDSRIGSFFFRFSGAFRIGFAEAAAKEAEEQEAKERLQRHPLLRSLRGARSEGASERSSRLSAKLKKARSERSKLNFSITDHMIRYKSWHFATSLIFAILQKRFLYNKNLIITKMLSFDNPNQSSLREPPSPPASSLLMPSKKYENFKRIEHDFQQKATFSIYEKMQMHQKQRFLKRLYNKPVLESFKSQLFENRLTIFESSFKEFSYNKDSNLLKLSSSHSYYKNRLNIRHRFSLINQWWNGQLAEQNVEVTYLSDIDWRTMYIQSFASHSFAHFDKDNVHSTLKQAKPSYEKLGLKQSKSILSYSKTSNKTDSMLDFPDADQHYNLRIRRWFLNANSWNYWLNFENTFYYEIYSHMIYDIFNKTSLYFNQNRELLDFFVYTYNIKGSLKEIDLIFILSRFYRK
uniref:Cell division protein n=1 Tax=Pediastrum duplex TaxID=3105 RepID=A0A1W5RMF2_PEDDU|nr:cell division protein [Pediastrum duplex]AQU64394.1 cell division protein [Pediastrum duplex]